jgi:hypothetical protein
MSRRQATTLGWTALAAAWTWAVDGAANAGAASSAAAKASPETLANMPSLDS